MAATAAATPIRRPEIGYTTDFWGEWTVTPPLPPERVAYLKEFAGTRRVKRDPLIAENMYDPIRAVVGLPIGPDGGYYVGAEGFYGQNTDVSVIDGNGPPSGQPGLWCQWIPSDDGTVIAWDSGEKFYEYESWIAYLIEHFLKPWGHVLNGDIEWQGEDSDDRGVLRITNNVIEIGVGIPGYQFNNITNGGSTPMATKTATAPTSTNLPAAVPAAVLSRKAQTTSTTTKNVHNFAAWKDAIGTAQAAAGYERTSAIYGKTDIEVLTQIKPTLTDLVALAGQEISAGNHVLPNGNTVDSGTLYGDALVALTEIDELLKRKVAKQIAGQTYKSRKTI